MRRYLILRVSATVILISYLGIRKESPPQLFTELVMYNAIPLICVFTILLSPKFHDRIARYSIASALILWTLASAISTADSYELLPLPNRLSDLGYVSFYPLMIIGLSRALRITHSSKHLEFIDTVIIALGLTSVLGVLFIKPMSLTFSGSAIDIFLTIFYPIGDLLLLALVFSLSIIQQPSLHNFFLGIGLVFFTSADFYFLWASATDRYHFGDVTDAGWLLGYLFIAESFWHRGEEARENLKFNPILATFSLLASAFVLIIAALRPSYFPSLALIPAFGTLALAFIRMTVAIREAHSITEERILARTDELTGLANRRKFISELEQANRDFSLDKPSSILLLDLNGFKSVNDQFGHDAGDDLLKRVALRFSRVIPHGALLARLGGDEFGVIVRGDDSHELAQAIRATLSYPFDCGGKSVRLDVSIGEAVVDGSPEILRRADEAMYQAKRAGGGVVLWQL